MPTSAKLRSLILIMTSSSVSSCAFPVTYAQNPHPQRTRDGPVYASFDSFTVKPGFIYELKGLCGDRVIAALPDKCPSSEDKSDSDKPTSYSEWLASNCRVSRCLNAITLHAVQQCSVRLGRQNAFADGFSAWLFPAETLIGLAADAAAVNAASASGNDSATALGAVALANSGGLQKAAPSHAVMKVSDFLANEKAYIQLADFINEDVDAIGTLSDANGMSPVALKFARFHDAMMGACIASTP